MSTRTNDRPGFDLPAAALWMSAFVLFGLLIVQASRLGVGTQAIAGDSASSVGDVSALTVSDGDDQDVLLILDGREQELFVYTIQGSQRINAPTVVDLNEAFNNARGTPESNSRRGR
ncbi:MAG: hypothetical protein RLN60_01575 [Phycisphaerales bacterium]